MPLNVFGNSFFSHDKCNKIDTLLFVQKPYLTTNHNESNIEVDIDLKNQLRTDTLPGPISNRETVSKKNVDEKFNDPSKIKKLRLLTSLIKISIMFFL